MKDLYIAIIHRLHADAAAAVSKKLLVCNPDEGHAPVEAREIHVGRTTEGRWFARVGRPAAGWLGAYSGDTCDSEAEALCSLVERAQRETEDAGGEAPFHLIDQLADDATVLAVYRKQTPKLARAAFRGFVEAAEAIDELDFVAEADVLGTELDALRRPAVGGA